MRLVAILLSLIFVQGSFSQEYSRWSAGVGTGALFFQGDEEYNSSVIFDTKLRYRASQKISLETSLGWMPFLDGDSSNASDPARWHIDDSQASRAALDALYHMGAAHLAVTGGAMYYNNTLEGGDHFRSFVGAGAGFERDISQNWDLRGDYRLLVEPEDGDINHLVSMSLLYNFGTGSDDGSAFAESSKRGAMSEKLGSTPGLVTIFFEYDKSGLTAESKSRLKTNAEFLIQNPSTKVVLEGHCDERGTDEYNFALGERRANSAKRYLEDLGVESDRMTTVSYGEEVPAVAGSNEAAWSKNRRVETVEQ